MNVTLRQAAQALRLRRLRVDQAERTLMRRREALEEALGELQSARAMVMAWDGAADELESWIAASAASLHRWSAVIETRRHDFQRGCTEARRYVEWWETQTAQAREAEQAARQAWIVERGRLDALARRHATELRHAEARAEESALEELSEAFGRSGAGSGR
jgi:uncharacterized protein (DUF3084 family)